MILDQLNDTVLRICRYIKQNVNVLIYLNTVIPT